MPPASSKIVLLSSFGVWKKSYRDYNLNDAQNHEYPIFAVEAADTAKNTAEVAITAAKKNIIDNRKIDSDAAAAVNPLNVFRIYLHTDIERTRDASKTIRKSVSSSSP